MRVYVDSNILIASAVSVEENGNNCRRLLTLLAQGKATGLTSALTFDEVFYQIKHEISCEAAVNMLENLLAMPNLEFLNVDTGVLRASLSLLKRHNIEPRDAIHAATSMLAGADVFVTEDKNLFKITELAAVGVKEVISKIGKESENQ